METFLSVCLGIGLAAACGFRIFVPFLVVSLAMRADMLSLAPSFEWIGSLPALIAFAVATALEIGAYYIPWLDNLLDGVTTPAAVVAGVVVSASVITDMDPLLKWTLAVIAGGGVAGMVQGVTGLARGASTLTTAGFANPVLATAELVGSAFLSTLALIVAPLAVLLAVLFLVWAGRLVRRRRQRRPAVAGGG